MVINGGNIEIVTDYKYLGTIDYELTWNYNTDTIYKKGMQRLYFMHKLRRFRVDRDMMLLFYHSFYFSVLLPGISRQQLTKTNLDSQHGQQGCWANT